MMRVLPHLMFQGELNDALALWKSAFPDMVISRLDDGEGPISRAEVTLAGQTVSVFDSPPVHAFSFTPSFSFIVQCSDASEVDRLAETLGEGGTVMMPLGSYPFSDKFTWFADRYGVSWQIMLKSNE